MKKSLYIALLGFLGLVGFTRADVNSLNLAPATQSAISGSLVTFTVTGNNGTGDAYLKYTLPQTANYDIVYQNATLTPLNNALLSLGIEHNPVFYIPANSNFSVTITAKVSTTTRSLPMLSTTASFGADMQITNVLTSAVAQISPISDLMITNILTGMNPSISGDIVSYMVTLQNIGSTQATGIAFISNFPIPTLATPTATFDGVSRAYANINYPQDFVWSGNYLNNLNPGQSMTIIVRGPMTQNFAVGTTFTQIAKATTASPEYAQGNNSATATGSVQAPADVWVTKTLAPFTGYKPGDQAIYTISYGNSGGKIANNVSISDIAPTGITIPTTSFSLGNLPAGSGGSFVVTGTLTATYASGFVFVNKATISTSSNETSTTNNSALATGTTIGVANVSLDIIANNLTHPMYDNIPYGSGPATLIQAISGDVIQFTITYANFGNTPASNGVLTLAGIQGLSQLSAYNGTLGTLPLNTTGTLIITGIVGPKNYTTLTPTVRLTYNTTQTLSDSVTIQEPMICGDGALTRTETCDTQGDLGVLFSGQVCENQQGMCVLVTKAIINNACINYQYTNPLGGVTTGQSCSSVNATLMNANCATMTGALPVLTSNGYSTNFTCNAANASATTPITIDCGNGTSISGTGTSFNGTCNYASSFIGNAQCRVGNDANNGLCRVPVTQNQMQCSVDALDGNIVVVDGDDNNFDGESDFRCSTLGNTTAQSITIDCGNGDVSTSSNTSSYTKTCRYNENNTTRDLADLPRTSNVRCTINNSSNQTCQTSVIVDQGTFGMCGDNIRQGYEDCDGTDTPDGATCTANCDIASALPVGCFNVSNANLSVQENELLPFWRVVDGEKNAVSSCNNSNTNKVEKDSLTCTFTISNKDGIVDTIERPCKNSDNSAIFNYFNTNSSSIKNAYGKYTTVIDKDVTDGIYGEYKISLAKVDYNYCNGSKFVSGTPIKRVCETNFTVTKPYLIQKSSFGLTPKTTTDLSIKDFYGFDEEQIITSTELDKIMDIDADTYKGGSSVSTMMTNFINKYSKLAVKSTTIKSDEGNTITVYKVPGQDIVVFKGQGTITYTDTNKTKPYTVIIDGPSLKINGSIENSNAMFLLNKGDITVMPSKDACTKTQVLKGIFITNQGSFLAGSDLTNNDTNKSWCPYGGLKVQGIMIGNNIDALVQSRRSQLNHWFTVGGTSDSAIKTERRNEIFNGAALLIEYSPSLWSALPPGASDFTKVLDVYKQ